MKKGWIATGTSLLCAAVLLSGCGNTAGTKSYGTRTYDGVTTRALHGGSYGASDTTTYGTPGLGGLTTTPDYGATSNANRYGTVGNYGTSGYTGTTGMYGTSGYTATPGTYGTSGYTGTTGMFGTRGYTGTTGTYGTTGYTGTPGTTGTTGYTGTTGTYGTTGYSGTTGTYGTTGYTGTTGTYGRGGYTGYYGTSGFTRTGTTNWTTNTGGLSSNLEHRLRQAGVHNVKVLAIGDTLILGETSRAHTRGTGQNTGTDLSAAVNYVRSVVGGGAKIMTVTDQKAIQAMDRVKTHLNTTSDKNRNHSISKDLALIVDKAIPKAK